MDWVEKYRRKHPFRYWWSGFRLRLELYWAWVWNEPVWDFSQDEPRAVYARTGQELSEEEMRRQGLVEQP